MIVVDECLVETWKFDKNSNPMINIIKNEFEEKYILQNDGQIGLNVI